MPKKDQQLQPTAIEELTKRHSAAYVAKAIGVSPSAIYKAIRIGKVSTATELAARYVQSREDKAEKVAQLTICRVAPDKRPLFETFMRGAEIKWTWFKEE